MKFLVSVLLLALLVPMVAHAALVTEKEATLLAVSQDDDGNLLGGTANLKLEVRDGSGRVFIDTYPLTKIDTQISARLAKEIACNYAEVDCDQYDFVYTIRSSAPTIGGPSAGAAIAGLTVAGLLDLDVSRQVAITGTIGSGGLVGHVGGIEAKVRAGAREGLSTVLIPLGQRFVQNISLNGSINQTNATNVTIDVQQVGERIGVDVVEVATIDEVVEAMTGYSVGIDTTEVIVPDFYTDTMAQLAGLLCTRAEEKRELYETITPSDDIDNITALLERATGLVNSSNKARASGQNYAAASFCFGAALQYNYLFWSSQPREQIEANILDVLNKLDVFERPQIETQTALQTAMLVEERLVETKDLANAAQESLIENRTLDAAYQLAFAQERLHSAVSWSAFFDVGGQDVTLDANVLADGCSFRVSEAEERQQYVSIYLPQDLGAQTEDLDKAYEYRAQANDVMCIFFASKAKAYYDVLISSLGSSDSGLRDQLNARFTVAQYNIQRQLDQGVFPIAAFSYGEYGKSLISDDLFSALLYLQYAIELSDMQIYLQPRVGAPIFIRDVRSEFFEEPGESFLLGLLFGLSFALFAFRIERWLIFRRRKK